MTDYLKKAPWVVNAGRTSNQGFYYDDFGYKSDKLFWADELDLEPSEVAELQRRICIKESLDEGLANRAVEAKHGPIPKTCFTTIKPISDPSHSGLDSEIRASYGASLTDHW